MKSKVIIKFYNSLLLLLIVVSIVIFDNLLAQSDSTNIAKSLTGIADSLDIADSTINKRPSIPFLTRYSFYDNFSELSSYVLRKKQIDFSDYNYSGDILKLLPFSFLNNFGSLGSPNESRMYSFGNGNISINIDGNSIINSWNNSTDLNRVQTESIGTVILSPLTRGFLYGFENNSASLAINTVDSLKSKPISRIRYYQAANNEAFIDAMFSARVLPRLMISMRVTNSSIDDNFVNQNFGAWKFNFKALYKIKDSIYAKVKFYHLKLNTALNGGIDINSLPLTSTGEYDIYNTLNSVLYEDRKNTTTLNEIYTNVYGKILPFGTTNVNFGYSKNHEVYEFNSDTTNIRNNNDYRKLTVNLEHKLNFRNFRTSIYAGYQNIDYELEGIDYTAKKDNHYVSIAMDYSLIKGLLKPAVFGKYSKFNSQNNNGFGADIIVNPFSKTKLVFGYSNYDKPLSILETQFLSSDISQSYAALFSSIEYSSNTINAALSYFNIGSTNTPIPFFNNSNLGLSNSHIFYEVTENLRISGFNFITRFEFMNILGTANFNYYSNHKNSLIPEENNFNLTTGIYYVDTLYNSNLHLKTGFTFYLFDEPQLQFYDFQNMRSASYYVDNNSVKSFQTYAVSNNRYRLDFVLAGRIQEAATFYFVYENILGNKYFILPYFPMPEGGIKIGIAWDFLD